MTAWHTGNTRSGLGYFLNLTEAIEQFGSSFAVITSFQREGMVLVDMASRINSGIRVITIDTGRLPAETHEMMDMVQRRYGVGIEVVRPDPAEVETMVRQHGKDLFRETSAHRLLCCQVRKVRPLNRKLQELKAYAVGLRRGQSETRSAVEPVQVVDGRFKLAPLADWTSEQVDRYLREHDVPMHPLYARGYESIGCDPCTRAIAPGEDERAGRWWWEQDTAKECGLHFTPDGRALRTVDLLLEEVLTAQ